METTILGSRVAVKIGNSPRLLVSNEAAPTWKLRSEPCDHDSFGWTFVDDAIFNFTNWEQCDRCTGVRTGSATFSGLGVEGQQVQDHEPRNCTHGWS